MTIANALTFIERGLADGALRARLNAAISPRELQDILVGKKIAFSAHEFDEAYHHRLTLCQEEEDADQLKEFKLWWDLLHRMLGTAAGSANMPDNPMKERR
jgi:hypothetical protein